MRVLGLLSVITILQVFWIGTIWFTGAAPNPGKLPLLLGYSLACVIVVNRLPEGILLTLRQTAERAMQNELRFLLTAGIVVGGIGGVYAHAQRGWPDEPYIFAAARIVAEQGLSSFFTNYAQIPWLGVQHPPLVILLYGLLLRVFGPELLALRLVSFILSLGVLWLTYRLGSELYDRNCGLLAATWLLFTPFLFRVGTTAFTDMPVTFCFVLAIFLTLRLLQRPTYRLAVGIGLCIGAGLLCKYTMVFIYPVVLFACLASGQFRLLIPYVTVIVIVSMSILGVWLGYAAHLGVFTTQRRIITTKAQYGLMTTNGRKWLLQVLFLRLPSGIGVYNLPLLFLGGWQVLQRRARSDVFLLAWIVAVCLPLILTLPGPRYFLPAFPALAIAMARGFLYVGEGAERVVLLILLYWIGALYLFVDWFRAAGGLFIR
jgi:4-amino-4-deoxy-L-arabinose transferase-like glycosyltransferase